MYSIYHQVYDNVFDILKYTISAMKETGFDSSDITEFISDAIKGSNYELIATSQSKLSECNQLNRSAGDFYWDDCTNSYKGFTLNDGEDIYDLEDDQDSIEDLCDGLNRNKYYWENDIDDQEAYEGFDSCKNYCYKWDDKDDLCYDYLTKDDDLY